MTAPQLLTLALFGACYVYLCVGRRFKAAVVWAAVLIFLILRLAHPAQAFASINWNVIGTFIGTSVVAQLFAASRVPLLLAKSLVDRSPNVGTAIVLVCLLGGFVSAWVDNVATILIVAPVALSMAEQLDVEPAPFLIGLTLSTNLQGSATLIGDAPSMILAGYADMSFNDFFWFLGRPGLFFAVQAGAAASVVVLLLLFHRYRQPPGTFPEVRVASWVPTLLLLAIIVSLALLNMFNVKYAYKAGTACIVAALAGLVWYYGKMLAARKGFGEVYRHALGKISSLSWNTVFLLTGLFVLVGTLSEVGLIEVIAGAIRTVTGGSVFLTFMALVWLSVILSGFIDNIPYVTALVPVVLSLGRSMGSGSPRDTYLLLFGLLIGATVGGNLTPIGASANVVTVGILEKKGNRVSFGGFMRIGVPFTIVAVSASILFIWVFWKVFP